MRVHQPTSAGGGGGGGSGESIANLQPDVGPSFAAADPGDTADLTSSDGSVVTTGVTGGIDLSVSGPLLGYGATAPGANDGRVGDLWLVLAAGVFSLYRKTTAGGVLPITSSLVLDINADDIAGSDGDAIASFTDSGPDSQGFSQATSGQRPILKLNQLLGHSSMLFDGSKRIVADSFSFDPAKQYSIYIVAKATSGNNNALLSTLNDSTYNGIECELYYDVGGGVYGFTTLMGGSGNTLSNATDNSAATYITWLKKATSGAAGVSSVRMGGVSLGDTASHSVPASNDSNLVLGCINATGSIHNGLTGDLYRILAYEGIHSSGDYGALEAYIADYYAGSGGTGWALEGSWNAL